MIPIGFNPTEFRNNWAIIQDGLILIDYTDEELISMYTWNCLNLGKTVINITERNARLEPDIDVNAECLKTAEFALGNSLYVLQYNLISDGIESGNKGVQGMKYIVPVEWKRAWSKSACGSLLAQIIEVDGFIEGHNSLYLYGGQGISG